MIQPTQRSPQAARADSLPMAIKKRAVAKMRIRDVPKQQIAFDHLHDIEAHSTAKAMPRVTKRRQ